MRFWFGFGFAGLAFMCLLCIVITRKTDSDQSVLESFDLQQLWGGDGLVTTGDYVDGRKTVPGLHTDCIPGRNHCLLIPHDRY